MSFKGNANIYSLPMIRRLFLDFFRNKGHKIAPADDSFSFSLIPALDPTLLFINAGMAPLKNCFTGLEKPPYPKLVTCQKCLRVGGKHNDFEEIGRTKRHHTFFEMLGNFAFADYFQEEAISYAWEFLTNILQIDKNKLYVTVHPDDQNAYHIWQKHIAKDRIITLKENIWSMGDTGPTGSCSEIFYDLGEHLEGDLSQGDRYLEIWNLVFMSHAKDENGIISPLPAPSIDTGAGLERLSVVLNKVDDTYSIPEFKQLIEHIVSIAHIADQSLTKADRSLTETHTPSDQSSVAIKVLADHVRSVAFIISEGVVPSAEGRGYILRKLIRRSVRFGKILGDEYLLVRLIPILRKIMSADYPELNQEIITPTIENEINRFIHVLDKGNLKIEEELSANNNISGDFAFLMYDTFGFPIELLKDIGRERNINVDIDLFEQLLDKQRKQSKKNKIDFDVDSNVPATEFVGYEMGACEAKVLDVIDGQWAILDRTPFYAQSGGQLADSGVIECERLQTNAIITDVQKKKDIILHHFQGHLQKGDVVVCKIDESKRDNLRRYHTATHLLHAALKFVLGPHVTQKGSLVAPERLRFDFSHPKALTKEQITMVENQVNQWIQSNNLVKTTIMPLQQALDKGVTALFGEKYQDQVRVVEVEGNISSELCGGTHVNQLSQIGCFRIIKEQSCGAGIRRIEAVAGQDLNKQQDASKISNVKTFQQLDIEIIKETENLLIARGNWNQVQWKKFIQENTHKNAVLLLVGNRFILKFNANLGSALAFIKNMELIGGGNDELVQGIINNLETLIEKLENHIKAS